MPSFKIEIYIPPGCTSIGSLRTIISKQMTELSCLPHWMEYSKGHPALPAYFKKASGIAVAINEQVVLLPSELSQWEFILTMAFKQAAQQKKAVSRWRSGKRALKLHASFFLSLFVALFPKCPFCWAAYLSLFGLAGARSIPYKPWFLPVAIILLIINLLSMYMSRNRNSMLPFWMSVTGAVIIIINRIYFQQTAIIFLGGALLLIASMWNALPRRMVQSVKLYIQHLFSQPFKKSI